MYIWQRPGWPDLRQDHARLAGPLGRARHAQGRLRGRMEALGPALRRAAMLGTLTPAGPARRSPTASASPAPARRRRIRAPTASSR